MNCDTQRSSLWWVPCINILAHLYRRVQRSCFSSRPSGWVPGRLMDGAHPLWPAEFYLRLTSRCCHRCFLAAPPSSISLLHPAQSVCFTSLCTLSLSPFFSLLVLIWLPWPISFSAAASSVPAGIPLHSGMAASLHQNDKQGGEQTPTQVHTHTNTCLHSFENFNSFMDVACHLLV